jgi:hypothetical protein
MRTPLGRAALLVLFVHVLHDLDHVRQRESAPAEVVGTAILGWAALIGLLVLVARRHRFAPAYAAVYGVASAAGFVLVHLVPRWSAFSAPYSELDADALSWLLAILPVAAGLYLTARAVRPPRLSPGGAGSPAGRAW